MCLTKGRMFERSTPRLNHRNGLSGASRKLAGMTTLGQPNPYCGILGRPVLTSNKTFAHAHSEPQDLAGNGHWTTRNDSRRSFHVVLEAGASS